MSKPDQLYISHTPVYHSGGRAEMAQPIQQYGTQAPVYYAPTRNSVNERKFRVCCCCPATCCIIVVIVLNLLFVLNSTYMLITGDLFGSTTVLVLDCVNIGIALTIAILLIAAIVVKKPSLACLATILQIVLIIVSIASLVLSMMLINEQATAAANQIDNSGVLGIIFGSFTSISTIMGGFLVIVLGLWFTYAIHTYKRYLDYYGSNN